MTYSETFRQKVREAAIEWVHRVIAATWPREQCPDELAETLVAIGELHDVPDEALIQWLHFHRPEPARWHGECERYVEARKQLLAAAEGVSNG